MMMATRVLVATLLLLAASIVSAQTRPVRVLVGLPPGGSVEVVARVYSEKLRQALGQVFLVENRVGASGMIALDALLAAPADGSVVLFAPNGGVTLVPRTLRKSFDPFKDVVPIASVARLEMVIAANAEVPAKTLQEFIALARGDARYRTFGAAHAAIPHLVGALFAQAAGLEVLHVAYRGAGQVVPDLIGGQLLASVLTSGEALPHARAGKLRMLATTGARRSQFTPDVPTLREAGLAGEIEDAWFGFYALAGTPAAALEPIARALVEASRAPDVRERFAPFGIETVAATGADVVARMRADAAIWTRALGAAGIKAEN